MQQILKYLSKAKEMKIIYIWKLTLELRVIKGISELPNKRPRIQNFFWGNHDLFLDIFSNHDFFD